MQINCDTFCTCRYRELARFPFPSVSAASLRVVGYGCHTPLQSLISVFEFHFQTAHPELATTSYGSLVQRVTHTHPSDNRGENQHELAILSSTSVTGDMYSMRENAEQQKRRRMRNSLHSNSLHRDSEILHMLLVQGRGTAEEKNSRRRRCSSENSPAMKE